MEDHQTDWDDYLQSRTYAYNVQVHRSTETNLFEVLLTRHPPGIAIRGAEPAGKSVTPTHELSPTQYQWALFRHTQDVLRHAAAKLKKV